MKKYEVILLDLDETLFDFKKTELYALEKTFTLFNIKYDEAYHLAAYSKINTQVWKDLEQGLLTTAQLKVERFRRLIETLDLEGDATSWSDTYAKCLGEGAFLLDGAKEFVEALSKKYRLGVITNGIGSVQHSRLERSDLASYFETVIISEEVKVSKPNEKIFEIALESLNHKDLSTVLMIGDSLTSDIQGGINAGVDTCWYNPQHIDNVKDIKATYEVHSYEDIKKIL